MRFEGTHRGPITIRTLEETDVSRMAKWLSDERVLDFWEGRSNPFDEQRVREVFVGKLESYITPCIAEYEGRPLGYLQFYEVQPDEREVYGYQRDERVYGIDQFIGEPDYWNRGIGTEMVRAILDYLFRVGGASRVVLDPHAENARAIRSYEKCGFAKVKFLPAREAHDGVMVDCWLMEVTPHTFRNG